MSRRVRVDVEPMRVVVAERATLARSVFAAVAVCCVAGTLHLRAIDPPRRDDVVWPAFLVLEGLFLGAGLHYVAPRRVVVVDRGMQEVRAELRYLGFRIASRKADLARFRGAHWRCVSGLESHSAGSDERIGADLLGLGLALLGGAPGTIVGGLHFLSRGDRPAEIVLLVLYFDRHESWEAIGSPERADIERAVGAILDLAPRSPRGRRAS